MLKVNQLIGFGAYRLVVGGGGPTGPAIVYRGVVDTGNSISIGTAAADRLVLALAFAGRGASTPRTLTAITFDGAAGDALTTTGVGSGTSAVTLGMSGKVITTGTTFTPAATYSGGVTINKFAVYTLTGWASSTLSDSKVWKTGDSAVTISVPNNGCVIMLGGGVDGTLGDLTFTGVTEDDDQTYAGVSNLREGSGSVTNLAADAARALSLTSSATSEAFVARTYA